MGVGRHTLGYDGILIDAIGCAKLDEAKFSSFENKLFELIYGSNYKPDYTNLDNPLPQTYYSPDTLQYVVSAEQLYNIENATIFVGSLPWGKEKQAVYSITSWQTLQGLTPSCIYYSREPGYVAWILNPMAISMAVSLFKADARQFLLDTDLIIGAIPSRGGVALNGDTLFRKSIGRSDLLFGYIEDLMNSLKYITTLMPNDCTIYPDHDLEPTIGFEKKKNSYLLPSWYKKN